MMPHIVSYLSACSCSIECMRVYVFDGYAGMLKNIIDQLNFKQILFYI